MAKFALLIGVGNYEHPDYLKPLVSAPKDVAAMQRILLNPEMGDFTEVIPLIDPDPMQMQEAIETLYRDRAKDDLILLFFSGHGIKDDSGKLYFTTRLTRKTPKGELIRSTAVPARFVREIMDNSRWRRQVLILDCCFSGAFDQTLNTKDDGSVDVRGQLGAEGRVVLTSSSSTEYSFEQQEDSDLSIYTRFLVEGIETGAADRDNDGKVSVQELHDYATKKVQETAPAMNPKIIVLKDEGFDVVFAKAHITDPKLKYRREVECYSSRGEISPAGRTVLNKLRVRLGLTLEEAKEIEDQVLQPFRDRLKHLEEYRSTFVAEVERQPLTQETLNELKGLQKILALRKEDVTQIEEKVTTAYHQKLQRYQQALTRAIKAGFPLSQPVCEDLDKFQADLGLSDENVAPIKQPIIKRRTAEYQQQQLEQQRQQDVENLRQRQEEEKLHQQEAERLREQPKQQKDKLESQPAKLQKQEEVKQHKKSSQTKENVRSFSSNKLPLAGAFLSSLLITAGGLFYFNSTRPQPQLIVEKSISTSPTPPTQSSLPTQFVLAKAQAIAKGGDKSRAIKLAQSVNGAQASEAQSLISQWQPEWEKEQDAFEEFKAAYKDGDWQKAYDIAYKKPFKIPDNKYWDSNLEFQKMLKNATKSIKKAHTERKKACELAATQRAEEQTKIEAEKNQASVSQRPSAEEFIGKYYATIRSGDTRTTWQSLTECFKLNMTRDELKPYDLNQYNEFWLEIQPKVVEANTIEQTQELAEVEALLAYQYKTKPTTYETSRFSLVWDSVRDTWQIDKNTKIKTLPIDSPPNNSIQGG